MRYLGGKARIANRLAPIVAAPKVWEPFMGGLSMSRALDARGCKLWLSDAHPALAPLYRAIQGGWQAPEAITFETYTAARRLPDSDPLKAFCGFGMSYGGRFFRGYSGPGAHTINSPHEKDSRVIHLDPCSAVTASLDWLRTSANVRAIFTVDFFSVPVRDTRLTIYCDPPYANTTGYSTGEFDSVRFWHQCREWARAGARVLVSEHTCPIPHVVRLELQKRTMRSEKGRRTERVFEILRGLKAAFGGRSKM